MTNNRSALLPIFRGENQARLLAALLLHPERESSIAALAVEIGADAGNLHADVQRLVTGGILADRRVGRTRLIRDAQSAYSKPLSELLMLAYGPKVLLEDTLRTVPGIAEAYIFGSWAARFNGDEGAIPHDVDLLVIGTDVDRDDIFGRATAVGAQLHQELQVVFRTPEVWADSADSFVATVRSRPLVQLELSP